MFGFGESVRPKGQSFNFEREQVNPFLKIDEREKKRFANLFVEPLGFLNSRVIAVIAYF